MKEPDLKGYVLGEVPAADRHEIEALLARDAEAALEVERLSTAMTALRQLPDQEPPRRIAFVSDKVFEPRWYQRLWQSAGSFAMASAMLSAAIVGHGVLTRPPVPTPPASAVVAQLSDAELARRVEAEVAKRLDAAVAKAVANVRTQSEGEQVKLVAAALQEAEKKFALEREADRASVVAHIDTLRKQMNRMAYLASNQTGGGQ